VRRLHLCEPRNKRSNGGNTLQWGLIDYQVDEVKGKDGRRHGREGFAGLSASSQGGRGPGGSEARRFPLHAP